jgi:hypothetical protein
VRRKHRQATGTSLNVSSGLFTCGLTDAGVSVLAWTGAAARPGPDEERDQGQGGQSPGRLPAPGPAAAAGAAQQQAHGARGGVAPGPRAGTPAPLDPLRSGVQPCLPAAAPCPLLSPDVGLERLYNVIRNHLVLVSIVLILVAARGPGGQALGVIPATVHGRGLDTGSEGGQQAGQAGGRAGRIYPHGVPVATTRRRECLLSSIGRSEEEAASLCCCGQHVRISLTAWPFRYKSAFLQAPRWDLAS